MIVSHDRYFMDNLVEHYFVFEGNGVIKDFNGTYDEYKSLKTAQDKEAEEKKASSTKKQTESVASNKEPEVKKLSYNERKEYSKLESEIEQLEAKKSALQQEMSSGITDYEKLQELSEEFETTKELIEEKEMRWLELAERA